MFVQGAIEWQSRHLLLVNVYIICINGKDDKYIYTPTRMLTIVLKVD